MKIFIIVMLLSIGQLSATINAQTARVTVNKQNVSMLEIMRDVESQSDISFVYSTAAIKEIGMLTVNVKNETVKKLLEKCLLKTDYSYVFKNNVVVIKPKEAKTTQTVKPIKGKVTNNKGEILPGVTIIVKGTKTGTATDVNGEYSIAAEKGDILVVTFIGMKPKEVTVGEKTVIDITLEPDTKELGEVVITGIFRRTKENATGASITVNEKQLKEVGNQNIIQSLKSLDPSFKLIENNAYGSDPNRLPEIELRGTNGIKDLDANYKGNPNQPLFILDGFETSLQRIIDLDPNRVASITILKDASAAALYGSRSANGVIVIETKSPKQGKLELTYTGDFAVVAPNLSSYDLLDAAEKLEIQQKAGHFDDEYIDRRNQKQQYYNRLLKNVKEGVDTYWLAKPLQTSFEQRHNLYVSGGDKVLRYGINFSVKTAPGVMKKSSRDNYQGGVFLSYRKGNVLFKNDLQVLYNLAKNSPYGNFSTYAKMNPYNKPYDENGIPQKLFDPYMPSDFRKDSNENPLYNASLNITDQDDYFQFINNFSLEWSITNTLKLMGRFSISRQTGEYQHFLPAQHTKFENMGDPVSEPEEYMRRGEFTLRNSKTFNIDGDINLRYGTSINDHTFFLVSGVNFSDRQSEDNQVQAEGFPNGNMNDIGFAKQYYKDSKPVSSYSTHRLVGLLFTGNYSYNNKYLADLSLKIDGSSNFGSENRYAPVWSAGLGWNIHNENFIQNKQLFSRLKLRTSYGVTASQNFAPYQALRTYSYDISSQYSGIIPAYLMALGNDKLKWQQTKISNLGCDLGFVNDRVQLTLDIYKRNTDNLLAPVTIAPSHGFLSYIDNVGETENNGYEANLRVMPVKDNTKQIFWSVGLSLSHNENKIVKISNAMKSRNEKIIEEAENNNRSVPVILYKEGESLTSIYGVRSLGINPQNGREMFLNKKGVVTYTYKSEDQVKIGDTRPDFEGIINTSFNYRNLSFNANLRYKLGGQIYNQTLVNKVENANLYYNVDKRVYDGRWQKPGDNTFYKDISDLRATRPTSRFIQDEDVLSFESISVGYEIRNKALLNKIGAQRIRFNAYMNDIIRFSTVKTERGTEYPFANRFAFSISATF